MLSCCNSGRYTSSGDFQMIGKFESQDLDAFTASGGTVYVVIDRKAGNSTVAAILTKYPVQAKIR